jgi:hypothetical protein
MAKRIAVLTLVAVASIGVGACGGDDEEGGAYDAGGDCRESIACLEETLGTAPDGTLEECIDASESAYRQASSGQRGRVDAAYEACNGRKACEYKVCVEDELGIGDDEGEGIDVGGPSPPECSGITKPLQGSVESSIGTFAYSDGEALFWVNDEGCLASVELELKSGSCSVRFSGRGLLDDQGRYLITEVSISMPGLCPGYPDGLDSTTYFEDAEEVPLGTIEVQREQASWSECRPGTLVVTPNVIVKGSSFTTGRPDIGFTTPIQVSGNFSGTHYAAIDGCPTVFF